MVAVNPGGRSEPGTLAAPVPIREVAGELTGLTDSQTDKHILKGIFQTVLSTSFGVYFWDLMLVLQYLLILTFCFKVIFLFKEMSLNKKK